MVVHENYYPILIPITLFRTTIRSRRILLRLLIQIIRVTLILISTLQRGNIRRCIGMCAGFKKAWYDIDISRVAFEDQNTYYSVE
jgi:hypothetical protein